MNKKNRSKSGEQNKKSFWTKELPPWLFCLIFSVHFLILLAITILLVNTTRNSEAATTVVIPFYIYIFIISKFVANTIPGLIMHLDLGKLTGSGEYIAITILYTIIGLILNFSLRKNHKNIKNILISLAIIGLVMLIIACAFFQTQFFAE